MSEVCALETAKLREILIADGEAFNYGLASVEGFRFADRVRGSDRRWTRTDQVIVQSPSGTYYGFYTEEPLTECQEDSDLGPGYHNYELFVLERHTKTVEVVEWINIKKADK